MKCLNCDQEFVGNYCPQCSQKSSTKRLTIVSVVQDFLNAISDSDKGFLKTVIDLSKDPGLTVNNYIDGKRSRYLSAGKYTFFLTVLFTINITYLEHHFGMFESLVSSLETASTKTTKSDNRKKDSTTDTRVSKPDDSLKVNVSPSKEDSDHLDINFNLMGTKIEKRVSKADFIKFLQKLVPHYHRTLFDVLKFLIILWIPIFSLMSFIFFFKSPYNMAEHLTFNSYVFSHILLIFIVISPLHWLLPQLSSVTFLSASGSALFYLIFSYMQFFEMRRYRLVKTVTSLSISFFAYICILITLMVALGVYIAVQNIDKL